MTLSLPRQPFPEIEQRTCAWCSCFPCRCGRSTPCVCGGIVAVDGGFYAAGVRAHNVSPEHVAWRARFGL